MCGELVLCKTPYRFLVVRGTHYNKAFWKKGYLMVSFFVS